MTLKSRTTACFAPQLQAIGCALRIRCFKVHRVYPPYLCDDLNAVFIK